MRRLILGLLAFVVVVLLAAAGAVYWFLSGDAIRRTLETQATGWLGQPVHIASAHAQLFPRIGIDLSDVRVGDPARLTFATVTVSAPLRPLLSRRIEDAEVTVARSRIDMPLPFSMPAGNGSSSATGGDGIRIVSVSSVALRDVVLASRGRAITVNAQAALAGSTLTIQRFVAISGRTELEASGVVALEPGVDARLTGNANRLDLDELVALANAFAPAGTAAPGRASRMPIKVSAHLTAATATVSDVDARNLATDLELDGDRVAMSPLSFTVFGGRYEGAVTATLGRVLTATVLAQLAGIDVGQLAAYGGVPGAMTGTLSGSGTFSGSGADFAAILRTVRGTGALAVVNGTIQHLDLVRTIVLFFGTARPEEPAGAGDRFDRIDAKFSLAQQRLRAEALSLHSQDADVAGQGTFDLASKALDGAFNLSLSESLSKQAGSDLFRYAHQGNRIVLPAKLGGTAGQPRLSIDAAAAVQRGLQNEIQRRFGDILDRLKGQQP